MNYYPFSVAVGAQFEQPVTGASIRYYTATVGAANPAIRIRSNNGADVLLKPGQSVTLKEFGRITVDNYDAVSTITGILQIGSADENLTDDRISGEVSVIDGGKSRTLSGVAFLSTIAKSATNKAQSQLWNPSGSGKRIIIEQLFASIANPQTITYGTMTTALTTLESSIPTNKYTKAGLTASVLQHRTDDAASLPTNSSMQALNVLSDTPTPLPLHEPVILAPNTGLLIATGATGSSIKISAEFYEEADS